jgi:hypothetical protein
VNQPASLFAFWAAFLRGPVGFETHFNVDRSALQSEPDYN